jgi:chemotaxis protein MotB
VSAGIGTGDGDLLAAAPRRKKNGRIEEPRDALAYKEEDDLSWLIPYVDVLSLLLAFLILTLAMAKVNPRKFELMTSQLTHEAPPPSLDVLKQKVDEMLKREKLEHAVVTVLDDEGLRAIFKSDGVLFESGQADITPGGRALIDKFIGLVKAILDERHLVAIEGHTDDVPIHTARYDSNWELSSARATVVLKSFLAAGFKPARLSAQGFADTRPAHPLDNKVPIAKARAENRRVVIRVYAGGTS